MQSDIQEVQLPAPTLSSVEIDQNIHQKVIAFAGLGGIAGLLMEGSLHPLDTVRTRIKCNTKETVGLVSEIKKMYRVEGPKSYFNGFSCTASGALVTNVTYFYTYEKLKHTFCKTQLLSKETAPFVAGFIGAFLANMVNLPFDVVRTRMQLPPGQYDYRNVYDGAKKVLKHEGVRKLYLGGPAFFTLNALEMGLTFGLYELFYKNLYPYFPSKFEVNIPLSIACSATAAGIAGFSINPLDVLVSRLQSQNTVLERQLSAGEMVRKIWRNEGLGGFFKGATGTMSYYALGALILFPTYETLKYVSGIDLSQE